MGFIYRKACKMQIRQLWQAKTKDLSVFDTCTWLLNTSWRVCSHKHLCKNETMVAETYFIYKKVTGTDAERMLTYVTMGLPLIEEESWPCLCGKISIFCCLQLLRWGNAPGDKQHFKGAWLPENSDQNEHKFQSAAIMSSSNSDQPKEEKQWSIGTDKLRLARRPPAELRQRISHHNPTRRATPI